MRSTFVPAALLVCAAVALVILLHGFLRRAFGDKEAGSFGGTVINPLAGVYGLLLAFLVSGVADRVSELRDALRQEAEAFLRLQEIAVMMPSPAGAEMQRLLQNYAHVESEFRSRRGTEAEATTALMDVWKSLAAFEPANAHEGFLQEEALTELRSLRAERRVAAGMSRPVHGTMVWVVLIAGSISVIAVCTVASLGDARARFYLAALTLVITITLYALYVLSRPLTEPSFQQLETTLSAPKVQ